MTAITVRQIEHSNDDLTVANAARVSFNKTSSKITQKDIKLIEYLAKNKHWTPFGHCRYRFTFLPTGDGLELAEWASKAGGAVIELNNNYIEIEDSLWGWLTNPPPGIDHVIYDYLSEYAPHSVEAIGLPQKCYEELLLYNITDTKCTTLRITMPIFVARQLMRSNVGIVYNEVSRRYIKEEPEFWSPELWRKSPNNNIKQGSGETYVPTLSHIISKKYHDTIQEIVKTWHYLNRCVAPEMARTILPVSMYTTVWMTATNEALERIITLRTDKHAQKEIQDLAYKMKNAISSP